MPKPPDNLEISQEAYEALLLDENWMSMRPSRFNDDMSGVQLLIGENVNPIDSIDVMRQFVSLVDKGITPNALILAAVAKGFRDYLSDGANTLDFSFNLKTKQRVGHPLKHRAERELKGRIAYLIWSMREDAKSRGDSISVETAAGVLINELDLPFTEETLTREYGAMKAEEVFGNMKQAIIETNPKQ
jgi:hypothetical protein